MNSVIKYVEDNHKTLFSRALQRVQGNTHDAEDVVSDLTINLLRWAKSDMAEKDIPKYVSKVLSHVLYTRYRNSSPSSDDEETTEGYTMEQLLERQILDARNPLELIIEEENFSQLTDIISDHTSNAVHRDLLTLIYVEGVDPIGAEQLTGVSYANRRKICSRFMKDIGDRDERIFYR